MSRDSRLNLFKKAVNKEHGSKTMGLAVNMGPIDIPRLDTGSLMLNVATGGGIPVGRTTMFWGCESSGKSTSVQRAVGLAQKLCANCLRKVSDYSVVQVSEGSIDSKTGEVLEDPEWKAVGTCDCYKKGIFKPSKYKTEKNDDYKARLKRYEENSYEEYKVAIINPEGDFDISWARSVGIDDRLLFVAVTATAEEAVNIYDDLIRTGSVDLVVLDSIAALTPSKEIEADMEDWQQGLQARLVGKLNRKAQSAINDVWRDYGRKVTQVWINQEREKIGIAFGNNKVMPGGNAQKFSPSLVVYMWPSKWEKTTIDGELIKEHQWEIGTRVRINFKVTKNKTAPAHATGSYVLNVAGANRGDVDELKFVMAQAKKYGLFSDVGEGAKKKWILGDEEFDTKKDCYNRVKEPDVYFHLKSEIQKKMLLGTKE